MSIKSRSAVNDKNISDLSGRGIIRFKLRVANTSSFEVGQHSATVETKEKPSSISHLPVKHTLRTTQPILQHGESHISTRNASLLLKGQRH